MAVDDETHAYDHLPKRPKRWPAFLAGFLLGCGISVGVALALWNQPAWWNALVGHGRSHDATEIDHHPTENEVVDYLDGKTLNFPMKSINDKPKTININKTNISDVKWSHGSRIGGSDEPWTHSFSCLYADETGTYILDLRIPVRVVGEQRVFLPLEESKVTPVDLVVTPKRK